MTTQSKTYGTRIAPGCTHKPRFLDGLAKKLVLARLAKIEDGVLILRQGDELHNFGTKTARCSLVVRVTVTDDRFYSDMAFGGSIGAGEAYMADYWQADDLTKLIRLLVLNIDVIDEVDSGLSRLTQPAQKILHWINRNTHVGSRRNIAAHYDLGNDFFKLMLDDTMMYSSAIFCDTSMTLYEAQLNRLQTVCEKLDLQATDHLLEIGTGWGGMAIYAAKHFGCRVTTTTLSQQQYDLACQRIAEQGLSDKITVLLEDYRDLEGSFDKLVSIEMIEAVGHQYYNTYFRQCAKLLKAGGLMLLQAITIADQRFDKAKNEVDFIKRYIFPGSCIPSISALMQSVTRSSDMRLLDLADIGLDYATTLACWRHNVERNKQAIKSLGYSDEFLRMWEFYLCYCEGGFAEQAISDVQMLLGKPR